MSDEILRIMCPKLTCRRILAVPSEARGRTVRCKGCATVIRVPARPTAPVEAVDPAAAGKPGKEADAKPADPKANEKGKAA